MKNVFGAALLAASLFVGSVASAAVLSVTGSVSVIGTPSSVTNAAPGSNKSMLVFNEIQNLVLGSNITTSTGVILAGTRVNSQMVLLNRTGSNGLLRLNGSVTFDGLILGFITSTAGLAATDAILGAVGTTYEQFRLRGLEGNESLSGQGTSTLALNLVVRQPGDWMRVVTVAAVPVPAAGFLLFGALGGLAALRRRKAMAA